MTEMSMQMIPSGELAESPLNPRKRFRDVEELADSIREQGILEPLLVRANAPRPAGKFFPFEVIAGARRLRAGRLAGLAEFPCVVRAMDDAQALEAMLAENNQRDDVSPLEEADAFGELQKLGRSTEDIAGRLGRSVGYVRARLRLLELEPEVRALLEEGRIHVGSALLLAQVSKQQQRDAAASIGDRHVWRGWQRRGDDPWSSGEVAALLRRSSRKVSLAVWPLDDDELLSDVGACTVCPKRTGAQRALLAEMEGDDLCLDEACWTSKTTAAVELARARGELVLEGPALSRAEDAGAYLPLDMEVDDQDFPEAYPVAGTPLVEWGPALARLGVAPSSWTLVVTDRSTVERWVSAEHMAELVGPHWPEAARTLRARMQELTWSAPATAGARLRGEDDDGYGPARPELQPEEQRAERERAEKEKVERTKVERERQVEGVARAAMTRELVSYAEADGPETLEWWVALARVVLANASAQACIDVLQRRGIAPAQVSKTEGTWEAARRGLEAWLITSKKFGEARGLLVELVAHPGLTARFLFDKDDPSGEDGPYRIVPLLRATRPAGEDAIEGIDVGRALKAARRELADDEHAAEAAAKKKAKAAEAKAAKKARAAREVRDGA